MGKAHAEVEAIWRAGALVPRRPHLRQFAPDLIQARAWPCLTRAALRLT